MTVLALVVAEESISRTAGFRERVTIALPSGLPDPAVSRACTVLMERLPYAVDGARRRLASPVGAPVAAWGDPEIILRCGVARPATMRSTDEAVEVNGVTWYLERTSRGYRFTTTGRVAYVEVTVPTSHAPEVNPLTDLASAVRTSVPVAQPTLTR